MKKIIILGAVGLALGLASLCFAGTSIRIAATIGETHQMNVTLSRVASPGATPTLVSDLTGTGMDFGTLVKDADHNFRSPVYFFIDASVVSNKTGWTITHTATDFANPAGDNLNANTNVVFEKVDNLTNSELALGNNYFTSYAAAKTRAAITQAELANGHLRIYYNLADGPGDAAGVSVIPADKPTGIYVGTVTLTLSL